MKILLVRHGIAMDRAEWSGADAERPLTDKGREKMKENVKGMKRMGIETDWILTSPYRRTYDTAQIIAKEFKKTEALKISRSLQPDGDPQKLMKHLAMHFKAWESLTLVGHEPYLSKLTSVLIGGNNLSMDFKKGGVAILFADSLSYSACARLEAFLPPRTLRHSG